MLHGWQHFYFLDLTQTLEDRRGGEKFTKQYLNQLIKFF